MTAFYNEIDPYAAAWLENLIAAGHIAPGIVDRRPIQEIEAWELAGFTQCHFFAGIGIWSHALRRAGWSDDRPIWTGSCPCQPFSNAGQRKGISDERHLWPYWHQLIDQCRPAIVLGEQVASKDGLGWLDLVSTDLEAAGYAFGASDLCAAGFGGAHIRQRLYFAGVADAMHAGRSERRAGAGSRSVAGRGAAGGVGNATDEPGQRHPGELPGAQAQVNGQGFAVDGCVPVGSEHAGPSVGGLADTGDQGQGGRGICRSGEGTGAGAGAARQRPAKLCATGGLAHATFEGRGQAGRDPAGDREAREGRAGNRAGDGSAHDFAAGVEQPSRPGAPLLGREPADWLCCRDGKWRPVEPGTFPLADEAPARVGRLRAYGNALDAETAANFCEVVREIADDLRPLMREFDL